jgi:peptidyl-prolyl cis-trans isomerase D
LAKEYSEDVGSNESGGDLGFSAGDTFPEAFEVALANLEINEISEAVETDAGIHIIKLLEVRGDKAPTLEEQKASIVYGLTRAKAEEQFTELLEILAEESYNAESLADVAESLGLEVVQSDLFGRSGGKGLLANAKVLEAAFSEDVLNEGNSSELIELNEQRVAVVKLINHVESHIKEQSLVAADIEATLKAEKVAQQLSARSAETVSALNNGDALAEVAANLELSVEEKAAVTRTDATIGSDIVEQAFSLAKPDEKPVVSSFSLNNGDFVVLSLSKVVDGDVSTLSAAEQQSLSTQLAMQSSNVSYQAYRDQLKASADIELR